MATTGHPPSTAPQGQTQIRQQGPKAAADPTKAFEAAVDSVSNGLGGLVELISKLSTAMVDLKSAQIDSTKYTTSQDQTTAKTSQELSSSLVSLTGVTDNFSAAVAQDTTTLENSTKATQVNASALSQQTREIVEGLKAASAARYQSVLNSKAREHETSAIKLSFTELQAAATRLAKENKTQLNAVDAAFVALQDKSQNSNTSPANLEQAARALVAHQHKLELGAAELEIYNTRLRSLSAAITQQSKQTLDKVKADRESVLVTRSTIVAKREEAKASKMLYGQLATTVTDLKQSKQAQSVNVKTATKALLTASTENIKHVEEKGEVNPALAAAELTAKQTLEQEKQKLATITANLAIYDKALQNSISIESSKAKQILAELATDKQNAADARAIQEQNAAAAAASAMSLKELDKLQTSLKTQYQEQSDALELSRIQLQALADKYAGGATDPTTLAKLKEANDTHAKNKNALSDTTKKLDTNRTALDAHSATLKNARESVTSFIAGFASVSLLANLSKLNNELQAAKTTGSYSSMSEFMGGQLTALTTGISSELYNTIRAQTRSAVISGPDQKTFDNQFKQSVTTLAPIAGSREDSAKLAAELYQVGAAAGISAKTTANNMDVLGKNFLTLSNITGKTTAELAKLAMAVLTDTDHREVIIGLSEQERANYVQRMQLEQKDMILKGFSIEQATELQKINARARMASLKERLGKRAERQISMSVLSQAVGIDTPDGQKVRALQKREQQIGSQLASGKDLQGNKLTKDAADKLRMESIQNTSEAMKIASKAMATGPQDDVTQAKLAELNQKLQQSSDMNASLVGINKVDAAAAEKKAGAAALGNDPAVKVASTLVDYGTALATNTAALLLLSGVMAGSSLFKFFKAGGMDTLKKVGAGTLAGASNMATKAGALATTAATLGTAGATGTAGTASAATAAGTAATSARALKIAKGVVGGPVALLAGLGLDFAADKAGGYDTTHGTALNAASNVASGASTGAMIGSVVPGLGTAIGAAIGGALGLGITGYNMLTHKPAKEEDKLPQDDVSVQQRVEAAKLTESAAAAKQNLAKDVNAAAQAKAAITNATLPQSNLPTSVSATDKLTELMSSLLSVQNSALTRLTTISTTPTPEPLAIGSINSPAYDRLSPKLQQQQLSKQLTTGRDSQGGLLSKDATDKLRMESTQIASEALQIAQAASQTAPTTQNTERSLEQLQRLYLEAGLKYFTSVDPAADKDARSKQANAFRTLAAMNKLEAASFNGMGSFVGA